MMAATSTDDRPWLAEGSEKRAAVRDMFAEIAPSYDLLNSIMSLRLHHRWRAFSVRKLELKSGDRVLDLCSGTGDFMKPLQRAIGSSGCAFGMDFCLPMLKIASKKGFSGLTLGDACRLPVRGESLDAVSVGWGIRNVPDIDAAHREIFRVLRPGGRFVSLDMARSRNAAMAGLSAFMFEKLVPRIGGLFGKRKAYTYLPQSTKRFMTREELVQSMQRAGLVGVGWKDMFLGNICVHWGRKP